MFDQNPVDRLLLRSYGYHSDDGRAFGGDGSGKMYGRTFGKGDIVGCGLNNDGELYFTLNGEFLGKMTQRQCMQ